jgi:hypothetical protein
VGDGRMIIADGERVIELKIEEGVERVREFGVELKTNVGGIFGGILCGFSVLVSEDGKKVFGVDLEDPKENILVTEMKDRIAN